MISEEMLFFIKLYKTISEARSIVHRTHDNYVYIVIVFTNGELLEYSMASLIIQYF